MSDDETTPGVIKLHDLRPAPGSKKARMVGAVMSAAPFVSSIYNIFIDILSSSQLMRKPR